MSLHLHVSSLVQLSLHSQCSNLEMFLSIGSGEVTTLLRTYLHRRETLVLIKLTDINLHISSRPLLQVLPVDGGHRDRLLGVADVLADRLLGQELLLPLAHHLLERSAELQQ